MKYTVYLLNVVLAYTSTFVNCCLFPSRSRFSWVNFWCRIIRWLILLPKVLYFDLRVFPWQFWRFGHFQWRRVMVHCLYLLFILAAHYFQFGLKHGLHYLHFLLICFVFQREGIKRGRKEISKKEKGEREEGLKESWQGKKVLLSIWLLLKSTWKAFNKSIRNLIILLKKWVCSACYLGQPAIWGWVSIDKFL